MPFADSHPRRLGVAAAVVDDTVVPGDVELLGEHVTRVGVLPAGRAGLAVPGFVDLQVNGYGGASFAHAEVDDYLPITAALARHGTTQVLATVITSGTDTYGSALATAAEAMDSQASAAVAGSAPTGADVLGVHLEGPFLSPSRRGAHPLAHLLHPDPALVDGWIATGTVRLVTLAPELPGAHEVIARLLSSGVTVSMGHTDVDSSGAHAAADLGVKAHTHVWNAHRPLASRDPGSAGVALTRPDLTPCFIADLVHVSTEVLAMSVAATAAHYVVVSDVSSSAGRTIGTHIDDGVAVVVGNQAVWLADGTLAGSGALLDQALRNLVSIGRPLPEAVAAITFRPAALIGASGIGRLGPGGRADVVVLDDALEVASVFLRGQLFDP